MNKKDRGWRGVRSREGCEDGFDRKSLGQCSKELKFEVPEEVTVPCSKGKEPNRVSERYSTVVGSKDGKRGWRGGLRQYGVSDRPRSQRRTTEETDLIVRVDESGPLRGRDRYGEETLR